MRSNCSNARVTGSNGKSCQVCWQRSATASRTAAVELTCTVPVTSKSLSRAVPMVPVEADERRSLGIVMEGDQRSCAQFCKCHMSKRRARGDSRLAQQRPHVGLATAEGHEGIQCVAAATLREDAVEKALRGGRIKHVRFFE